MKTLPSTLFKYQEFNVRSLQNLKAQSIYFASPSQFNDPYDCTITARIADHTTEDLDKMRRYYVESPETPAQVKSKLTAMSHDELRVFFVGTASNSFEEHKEKFLKEHGVSCFSEVNDDLLMWSHYGGRYTGFCLEFRTSDAAFQKVRPVRYVDDIPVIDLVPFVVDRDASQLLMCTARNPARGPTNESGGRFI